MRFQRLPESDLQELEQDFIHFLASASITAQDWVNMKEQETDKANELIEVFSDIVYEKVFKNMRYLDHRTPTSLKVFFLDQEKIFMNGIEVDESSGIDLTKDDFLKELSKGNTSGLNVFSQEKAYQGNREEEIFRMMQNGCHRIEPRFYTLIFNLCHPSL